MVIATGIVTHNPELVRLHANLSSISPQTDRVFIVDNGSDNISGS